MNAPGQQLSIISTYAATRHMEKEALIAVLFKTIAPDNATMEDLIGFLQLAHRFDLDPFAREIFMIKSRGKIQTYVGIDGYTKIVNRQPEYDGCTFTYDQDSDGGITAVTCTMYRKDRSHPMAVTEFLAECLPPTPSEAWKRSPGRMLRHRAFVQAARLTFGISGALDEGSDFSPTTIEAGSVTPPEERPRPAAKRKPPSPSEIKAKSGENTDQKPQPEQQQRQDDVAQFDLQQLLDAMDTARSTEELNAIYNDFSPDTEIADRPDDLGRAQDAFLAHSKRLEDK